MKRLNTILLLIATAAMLASLDFASFRIINTESSEPNILVVTSVTLLTLALLHRAPLSLTIAASIISIIYLAALSRGTIEPQQISLITFLAISVVAAAISNMLSGKLYFNDNVKLYKYFLHFLAVSAGLSAPLIALQSTPFQYSVAFLNLEEIFIVSLYMAATSVLLQIRSEQMMKYNWTTANVIRLIPPFATVIFFILLFSNLQPEHLPTMIYGFLLLLTFLQIILPRNKFSEMIAPSIGANVALYLTNQNNLGFFSLIGEVIIIPTASAIAAHLISHNMSKLERQQTLFARLKEINSTIIAKFDIKNHLFILGDPNEKSPYKITAQKAFKAATSKSILDFYAATNSKDKNVEKVIIKLDLSPDDTEENLNVVIHYSASIFPNDGGEIEVLIKNIEAEVQNKNLLEKLDAMLVKALLKEEHLLALASHELRTPLSIIEMFAEELQEGAAWEDIETDFLRTSNRMSRILDDLRLATSMDNTMPVAKPFSIHDLTSVLENTFASAAAVNECSLHIKNSENGSDTYLADYTRIIAALSRVLQNAIVHAPKSKITLSNFLSQTEDNKFMLVWQITDTGPGIAPQRLDTLFRPFQDASNVNDNGTAGLGLYTARAAMRIIGGDLKYERSDGVTRFIITHPILKLDERSMNSQTTNTESKMAKLSDKTALLVEDTQLVGEITVSRLSKFFGEVYWAKTGNAGLDLYKEHKPDIVFMDHLLPEMNGDQVTAAIREIDKTVPIIGVTASALGSECDLLEAAGANYALEKPLKLSQIDLIVTEFFIQR